MCQKLICKHIQLHYKKKLKNVKNSNEILIRFSTQMQCFQLTVVINTSSNVQLILRPKSFNRIQKWIVLQYSCVSIVRDPVFMTWVIRSDNAYKTTYFTEIHRESYIIGNLLCVIYIQPGQVFGKYM